MNVCVSGGRFAGVLLLGAVLGGSAAAQYPPPQTPPVPGQMRPFGGQRYGMGMSGLHILPPGLWWKDPDLVQRLDLTPDQQKRLDDTFSQNKVTLTGIHARLDQEQMQLQPMLDTNPVDQAKTLAEIGKIADLRAELEKAVARMLLQMRAVLTQAQWTRLQQERPSRMREHMFPRGHGDMPPMNGAGTQP